MYININQIELIHSNTRNSRLYLMQIKLMSTRIHVRQNVLLLCNSFVNALRDSILEYENGNFFPASYVKCVLNKNAIYTCALYINPVVYLKCIQSH